MIQGSRWPDDGDDDAGDSDPAGTKCNLMHWHQFVVASLSHGQDKLPLVNHPQLISGNLARYLHKYWY